MSEIKPVILIILDGFGMSPLKEGNAVFHAATPSFDNIIKSYPATLLHASGQEVGLEFGEIGNSEVGHLNLGTGRIVVQDLPRINHSIEIKKFFTTPELINACEYANKNNSTLHLYGLTSNGGVHSHIDHLFALMELAKQNNVKKLAIHIITDGRDTPQKKSLDFVKRVEEKIKQLKIGKIATVCGRYYAMDRDKHWADRTKLAYDLITEGKGEEFKSAEEAIKSSYEKKVNDENITPKIIDKDLVYKNNDSLICFNFRIDRMKQISRSIIDPKFKEFGRNVFNNNMLFTSFTNYGYEPTNMVKIAFLSETLKNTLSELLSSHNINHLHVAETEKYAHVTYFFNGGIEKAYSTEKRILVPSLRVKSYDTKPEMSAKKICQKFLLHYESYKPTFSVINFANPDMVGHSGDFAATVKGVETADFCLGEILKKVGENTNIFVTADHGNAEQMINPESGEIDKEHTSNPVPFVIVAENKIDSGLDKESIAGMEPASVLADVSPTILDFLNIEKANEMNGDSIKDLI